MEGWGFTTCILHADRTNTTHGAMHEPIYSSVAYGYDDAHDLVATFQSKQAGYLYGRQSNPTAVALQNRITLMEAGLASLVFATGMGAIGSAFFALCRSGDHVVSSQFLFGNTTSLFDSFDRYGLQLSFVDATDIAQVEAALRPETKIVFVETIANPRTQIADLEAIGQLCRDRNLLYIVDNTMTSPWLFQPCTVGAGLVVNSLTKYIGGHGRALGGALTETGCFDWQNFSGIDERFRQGDSALWGLTQIRKKGLRDFGASISAQAAHDLAAGAETLSLRMDRACENARLLAQMLATHSRVKKVYYPGLSSHPEYERSKQLFRLPGALLSFELSADMGVFAVLNRLKVAVRSTNLGDSRTLVIPAAQTIYHEMGAERRATMDIGDGLVRVSLGIEDGNDLLTDFDAALS